MTRDDAFEFSETLRRTFPRIRFLREDYAARFIDDVAWRGACDEAKRARRQIPRRTDYACFRGGDLPEYFTSLADVLETRFRVWVEPPRWRPRWRLRKRDDLLVIENEPRLTFTLWRGGFACPDPRRKDGLHDDPHLPTYDLALPPWPIDRKEPIVLEGHRMLGAWDKGNDTAKAFVHKVWRLLDKMSTNRLVAVDRRTLTPIPPDGSSTTEAYMRAANDALRWARGRRHNYLAWGNRWFKPEQYFRWLRRKDDEDAIEREPAQPSSRVRQQRTSGRTNPSR